MNEPRPECQQGYEEKIRRLELEARPLDPGPKERALLRDEVVAYADSFMERIDGRPAFLVPESEDSALYDSPISEESTDPGRGPELAGSRGNPERGERRIGGPLSLHPG